MTTRKLFLLHLGGSFLLALLVSVFIINWWFPPPFDEILNVYRGLALIVLFDTVAGPVLARLVCNPIKKARAVWIRDLSVIVILQAGFLIFGIYQVSMIRPVAIGLEGDRFRLALRSDLAASTVPCEGVSIIDKTPKIVGVRLLSSDDPEYVESVRLSLEGLHPAFRCERWIDISHQKIAPDIEKLLDRIHAVEDGPTISQIKEMINTRGIKSPVALPFETGMVENNNWIIIFDEKSKRERVDQYLIVKANGW